jgi:FdrA protein
MIRNSVEKSRYLDSVALMRMSRRLSALPGVEAASLMLGTPSNKALMREAGLLAPEGEAAGPNDLIIAVRAADGDAALEKVLRLLAEKSESVETALRARSSRGALELLPGANLALISVPGAFAAYEARRALERGLNVLVFSDNVAIEEEVALKRLAREKGLLLMGPDCGSALIAGTPVAFANAVPRGDIGIVSASGTGLQEVSTLIARLGGGISHGIGVGGRDLDERVGALGTLAAIDALEADPGTRKLVLISKPPSPQVAQTVMDRLKASGKPSVACFVGTPGSSLREAAEQAMQKKIEWPDRPSLSRAKGKVKGLYCGGTLCAEAEQICKDRGVSNYALVDLGDDEYTRGRPHPMIEPELRSAHVAAALADPGVSILLLDLVLGYGSHANPAQVLVESLAATRKIVIASVTGTEADPQGLSRQAAILKSAGVIVAPSSAHAAELAASLASK